MQLNSLRHVTTIGPSIGSKLRPNKPLFNKQISLNLINRFMTHFHNNFDSNLNSKYRHLLLIKFKHKSNNKLLLNQLNSNLNNISYDINSTNGLVSISKRNYCSKSAPEDKYTSSGTESSSDDEDLFHEPPKVRFGLLKVTLTIILGTYAGALFAMFGANFLEEYEIFVKGEGEDDDD